MNRTVKAVGLALLALAVAKGADAALTEQDWASKTLGIAPKEVKTVTCGRRSQVWYQHAPDPAWGAQGNYTDTFTVGKPVAGDKPGSPLVVQLHSRGGGMPQGGIQALAGAADSTEGVYRVPDDAYALAVDSMRDQNVQANKTNPDFWWGGNPKFCGPSKADVPRLRKGETPCAKRVLDTIEWVVRQYKIDRNRIYLCGNSMGGQGTLAIGLPHGEVFAAIEANVPATVWYPAAAMGFIGDDGNDAADFDPNRFADPPVCVDWSGSDDVWSRDHEIMYRNMAAKKYFYLGLWGDYGHCGSWSAARAKNPLIGRFDYLKVVKNAAYPVFTNASTDDKLPWPFSVWQPKVNNWGGWAGDILADSKKAIAEGAKPVGQVNAFFRWENLRDEARGVTMNLFLAGKDELGGFEPPASATADVSIRRIQAVKIKPGQSVKWKFGKSPSWSTVKADANGLVTIPKLTITATPQKLILKF